MHRFFRSSDGRVERDAPGDRRHNAHDRRRDPDEDTALIREIREEYAEHQRDLEQLQNRRNGH